MSGENPAQPILDLYDKVTGKKKPAPTAKPDTSWHDSMVKQAADSFRKPGYYPTKQEDKPQTVGKKPTSRKPGARKR